MEALEEAIQIICGAIHEVLEQTPPELSADISEAGIVINGGGALLYGIDKRIEKNIGINVTIAEDPKACVAIGTGKSLESIDILEKKIINQKRSY
jgi:rod shape-determining protein MreB